MKKIIVLIILANIIITGAGALAAHHTGYINLNPLLSKIPLLNSFVTPTPEVPENPAITLLEEDNKQLKKTNKELSNTITTLEGEKNQLLQEIAEIQAKLEEIAAAQTTHEVATHNVEEFAAYYHEMKPEAAAKIMDSLADETMMTVLTLLEKEQAGKIIALMDPQRAAFITQLLLDKTRQ